MTVRETTGAGPTPGPAQAAADTADPSPLTAATAPGSPAALHGARPVAVDGASTAVDAGAARTVVVHGGGPRRRRVVLVGAVAGALLAGGVAWMLDPGGAAGAPTVRITARYSRFEPDRVTVKPGSTVRFVIRNADPIDHEFIIGPPETHDLHERGAPGFHTGAVQGEVTVPAGATVETTWTFAPSGGNTVAYGCHLAGHWSYGMQGKALVR